MEGVPCISYTETLYVCLILSSYRAAIKDWHMSGWKIGT